LIRVGRALHITPSKKVLIKSVIVPRIGETVFDKKQRPVGRVFDVFGPTASPYVEVEAEDPERLIDDVLYISRPPKRGRRSRR
jgi:rRNA processing protein Gar1